MPFLTDAGVKLEYRDEFGRKLTQKEAFRQLCYKFHGYGPGHPLSSYPKYHPYLLFLMPLTSNSP